MSVTVFDSVLFKAKEIFFGSDIIKEAFAQVKCLNIKLSRYKNLEVHCSHFVTFDPLEIDNTEN